MFGVTIWGRKFKKIIWGTNIKSPVLDTSNLSEKHNELLLRVNKNSTTGSEILTADRYSMTGISSMVITMVSLRINPIHGPIPV